jgi:23S rRNA (uridine2552-2'-O)-methyltransferase
MAYQPNDHHARRAKAEGFLARSVYKLEEIDRKHRLIRPGDRIVDLGASPGSWSQYASEHIGAKGRVLGIDLTEIRLTLANVTFVTQDIFTADWAALFAQAGITPPVDVVLSDMAPKTTGVHVTDHARSVELCEAALMVAQKLLKPGGHFVCKMFDGEDFQQYRKQLQSSFTSVSVLRPESTRSSSRELFFIAKGFKSS